MMSASTSGMFACWMAGAYFWSRRADTHGRRGATLASAWGTLLMSGLACLSWSFYSFAVLRSLLGLFIGGQAACSFLLLMEWSHPRDASLFTFLGNFMFSVGLVAMVAAPSPAAAQPSCLPALVRQRRAPPHSSRRCACCEWRGVRCRECIVCSMIQYSMV